MLNLTEPSLEPETPGRDIIIFSFIPSWKPTFIYVQLILNKPNEGNYTTEENED